MEVIDDEVVYCAKPWRGVVEGRSNTKANVPILGFDRTRTDRDRVKKRDKRSKRGTPRSDLNPAMPRLPHCHPINSLAVPPRPV